MKSIAYSTLLVLIINICFASPSLLSSDKSFAEEYKNLRILLQSVIDTNSAEKLKHAIREEITRLKKTQTSGSEFYNSLSNVEKKQFIKRFQLNQFHCGEVTQVMQERRRILYDSNMSLILADILAEIP